MMSAAQDWQLLPLALCDLDEVVAIERTVYSHPWTSGNFSDALRAGYPACGLRLGGELLAYCVVMLVPDEVHILNLSVARHWQGRGLGQRMLTWTEQLAEARQCDSILLEVRVSNHRARRLYEQVGFHQIGLRRGYYPSVHGREDAIVMRKPLPAASVARSA